MTNERRGGRRPPQRPGGGGGRGEFRPYRPRPPYGAPQQEGATRDFAPREFTPRQGPSQSRGGYAPHPPARAGGFAAHPASDEGGMAIRVDPRRLGLLKELAAAEGLRPGQLVQRWIEERLDAERSGETRSTGTATGGLDVGRVDALETRVASLGVRVEELVARLGNLEAGSPPVEAVAAAAVQPEDVAETTPAPRRRGRPRKPPVVKATPASANGKVALHDEIIAVIRDRGPSTAAELATAIRERGHYQPPRSGKPLDAATVNGRVSNPVYRARFRRSGRRIDLAE